MSIAHSDLWIHPIRSQTAAGGAAVLWLERATVFVGNQIATAVRSLGKVRARLRRLYRSRRRNVYSSPSAGAICALFLFVWSCSRAHAAEPNYWQDVWPVLRKHCTVCHSERNLKEPEVSAGLALDSYAAVRRGGRKPVLVPGKSAASLLVSVLRLPDENKRMPLDAKPLPAESVALLQRWVDAGAPEGTRPAETALATPAPARGNRLRKLPVVIPTRLTRPGAIDMVLPVGPVAPVAALAYNRTGTRLAVGAYGRVTIWDTGKAAPVATITNVLGAVNDLKFSPDDAILAVSGGQPSARGDLRLFQVSDWKLLASLGGHLDVVSSVSFSPDGKRLASASFDKTVRIWNVASLRLEQTLAGHSDFVHAVAFGPKGDWIVSASKDRTIRLTELPSAKSRLTFSGMDQDVLAVVVAPNGKAIVSSGYEASLFWWDPQTGERTRRQGGHDIAVHELAFDRIGRIVVSAGGDKTVRWFDGTTGTPMRSLPTTSIVYAVAVRPDGQQIAAGCADGQVRLFDVATARPLLNLLAYGGLSTGSDWIAGTAEGYVAGSAAALDQLQWRASGKVLPSAVMRKFLIQSEQVAKAWRGEKIAEPTVPAFR